MTPTPLPRLTYCTNVHPASCWAEVGATLREHVLPVKQAFSPETVFPVGLWLSDRAAREPGAREAAELGRWCRDHGLFVATLNGFPFGAFHGRTVKQAVYRPDWRSPERGRYTRRLFDLLAGWLPDGVTGSVSTVPVGFAPDLDGDDLPVVRARLVETLEHVDRLRQRTGNDLVLALEPEPGCVLETVTDVVRFFDGLGLPATSRDALGVCYDACHHAVEFEDPLTSLRTLEEAEIRVAKVHASNAVQCIDPTPAVLAPFDEPVYLHQTVVDGGSAPLRRYTDLNEAWAGEGGRSGEWRLHYHVPVFYEGSDTWGTTRGFLEQVLDRIPEDTLVEVETYTWDVLPEELKSTTLAESLVRELRWVRSRLDASHRRP